MARSDKRNELTVRDAEKEVKRLAREKKAAVLRLQLARLEAGEDAELDEDDDETGTTLTGPQDVEGVLGTLGQIGRLMNTTGVEDTTAPDAEGGSGISFQRHAGTVRNVKIDRRGRIKEVDFQPEEWPPRHEKF